MKRLSKEVLKAILTCNVLKYEVVAGNSPCLQILLMQNPQLRDCQSEAHV